MNKNGRLVMSYDAIQTEIPILIKRKKNFKYIFLLMKQICVFPRDRYLTTHFSHVCSYTVAHKGGIFFFNDNLWNYFKNNLKILDLDNSIHSSILLNNNLPMCVLRDC